jgi:hypothetical protein
MLFFRRLKINHDTHEFILDSGTIANTSSQENPGILTSQDKIGINLVSQGILGMELDSQDSLGLERNSRKSPVLT